MAALTDDERTIWNIALTDRSYSSIAQQMGISQRAAKRLLRSASDKLVEYVRARLAGR